MELYRETLRSIQPDTPREIDERLRRRYLDRLAQRVKRLRKLLVERNWEDLRAECSQLAMSGETFGFQNLMELAHFASGAIPSGKVSRAATPIRARETVETLITAIDSVLIEYTVSRV